MRLIKETDLFELRLLTRLSSEDLRVLHLLYQPFLGNLAVSIYQTLVYTKPLFEDGPSSHEFLFKQLETNSLAFANALARLEACELLRTYVDKTNEFSYFYYEIYAPKLSKAFFKDPVFSGLLTSVVGERRVQQLTTLFSNDKPYELQDKEATSSFADVFSPNFNSSAFNQVLSTSNIGRNENKRKTAFNLALFKEELRKNYMIMSELALTDDDIKKIVSLTMIFSFNEQTMATQVAESFDMKRPLGQKIDFNYLEQLLKQLSRYSHIAKPKKLRPINTLNSDSEKAKLINRMEIESSFDFLASFNNGAVVANSDISLLTRLSHDFNLTNAVINALVYHVLTTKDMQLSSKYVEKIAGQLSRLGFIHAVDVLDHFASTKDGFRSRDNVKKDKIENVIPEDHMSEEEYKKLLEELNRA